MIAAKRTGRCLCGLKISLHFTDHNYKLSCEAAKLLHPTAKVSSFSLRKALFNAGASLQGVK